ncbi:MAG: DUF6607 family protein [Bacteroidota bacterium]
MYKIVALSFALCFFTGQVQAQKSKKQDIESIKKMCGCFKIKFSFAETFSPIRGYEYKNNYYSGALEYALPVEVTKDKIVIQHLLVINDSTVIKHWRQDWLYENTDIYSYHKDNTWKYQSLPKDEVKGQWTQKVYQVDDSPRYEASGSWIHKDGRDYWETKADSPLPRRERTTRSDYNVMIRGNRHEITDDGWVHEQDNDKILREDEDKLIAQEKGWNTYKRVAESECQPAIDWWKNNEAFWGDVRTTWDALFADKNTLQLTQKIDGKMMIFKLFGLGDEFSGDQYQQGEAIRKIEEIIKMHTTASDQRISAK